MIESPNDKINQTSCDDEKETFNLNVTHVGGLQEYVHEIVHTHNMLSNVYSLKRNISLAEFVN